MNVNLLQHKMVVKKMKKYVEFSNTDNYCLTNKYELNCILTKMNLCIKNEKENIPSFIFCLPLFRIVSPYAVVEGGGEAQPRQIGSQKQSGSAAYGIP